MEVVSGLCFSQSKAPEEKLVEMLLGIVFTERPGKEARETDGRLDTRELTPYKTDKSDENPVIRSFLLQLLLQHKYTKPSFSSFFFISHNFKSIYMYMSLLHSKTL